jgi:uncharacterized protein (TIGR00725 family)
MSKIIIGVMGPGETATAQDVQNAYQLGKLIALEGWVLLTGGRSEGVMDAASQGAKSVNGLTIGILPTAEPQNMSSAIDIPILTDLGNARNNINVLSSRVIVACGTGLGTISEIALALKAQRRTILLSANANSQQFLQQLAPNLIWSTDTPEIAISIIKSLLH